MITRETKIGLVVACSFLCLVAVVLAGKYTTLLGTPATTDGDPVVASNDKTGPDKNEASGKKDPRPSLEALPPGAKAPLEPAPEYVQTSASELDPLPPLSAKKTDTAPTISESVPATRLEEHNPSLDLPDPVDKKKSPPGEELPPLPASEESKNAKADASNGSEGKLPRETETKPTEKTEKAKSDDPSDPKKAAGDGDELPPLAIDPPAKKGETKPAAEVTIELPPPPPLKKNKTDSPMPSSPSEIGSQPTDTATQADAKPKPVPVVPLPGDNLPPKESSPPPAKDKGDTGLPDNTQYALGKPVPTPESPRLVPRGGERPGSSGTGTPVTRVPSRPVGSAPRVESFDEEIYRPRQDDSFASISKRYYQTDKFAQALLLFNREHPRAGEGVRHDPPVLAGQPVYVPPISVLEKRHGEAIEGYAPRPSNPTPVGRDGSRGRGAVSAADPVGAVGTVTYQVSPSGETMTEIARTKLGSGDRWRDIDKLNPGWRPDYPIPGGTTLRLPASRVSP